VRSPNARDDKMCTVERASGCTLKTGISHFACRDRQMVKMVILSRANIFFFGRISDTHNVQHRRTTRMTSTHTMFNDNCNALNQFERARGCVDIMHTYDMCNVHAVLRIVFTRAVGDEKHIFEKCHARDPRGDAQRCTVPTK